MKPALRSDARARSTRGPVPAALPPATCSAAPAGIGKHFRLEPADAGKAVSVRFDGVYMDAEVWVNGQSLGSHPYGYTSFAYDLTPHLNPAGQENVLAVRVRNEGKNSRWYSGSGIYRHVWLTVTDPLHVALWGIQVTTPQRVQRARRP